MDGESSARRHVVVPNVGEARQVKWATKSRYSAANVCATRPSRSRSLRPGDCDCRFRKLYEIFGTCLQQIRNFPPDRRLPGRAAPSVLHRRTFVRRPLRKTGMTSILSVRHRHWRSQSRCWPASPHATLPSAGRSAQQVSLHLEKLRPTTHCRIPLKSSDEAIFT